MKSLFYKTLKSMVRIGLRIYFYRIEFNGKENIPADGTPFLMIANHQAAFLDALILGALSPVPLHYLARASVFKKPYLWFLDALNMMPVYRIRDGYGSLTKNEAVFNACKELFEKDKSLVVFPEAAHGEHYYLRPLSKGTSRIVLQAQKELEKPLLIVPVGINYFRHFHPRHKLTLNIGAAIEVNDYLEVYNDNTVEGLKAIRMAQSKAIKELLVIPENSETYEKEKEVFSRKNEALNFQELKSKISLNDLPKEKHFSFLIVPAILLGAFNFIPLWINHYVLRHKTKEIEFYSSLKFAFGLLLCPLWWMLVFILMCSFFSFGLALIILVVQITSLILRQDLLRYTH